VSQLVNVLLVGDVGLAFLAAGRGDRHAVLSRFA
jgi:hypothetical protein